MKYFRIESGGEILCIHALDKAVVTLGRAPDNTIAISDPGISRNHVSIEDTDSGCRITDLNSHNGTYVNGQKVQSAVLLSGDRISIGNCEIVFALTETVRLPGSTTTGSFERMRVESAPDSAGALIPPPPPTLTSIPVVDQAAVHAEASTKVMVILVDGILDESTAPDFIKGVDDLLTGGIRRIVVEMHGIRKVGAGGWQMLVSQRKRVQQYGGDVKLARLRRKVLGEFRALGLDTAIDHYPSVPSAQAAFE